MKRLLLFLTLITFTFILFACGDDDTIIDQSPTFSHLIVDSREPTENGILDTYIKNKDEAIVVEVHFNNPSNAPINSVTINGQRYRTNRFEEGSSPTVVILNLTLRVTGETVYEVENFVYSDVNSVNIDSGNTYQVFVLKNLPSATLSNLEQGSEQLTMEIRVTDEDAVTLADSTTVELYQGDSLIESKDILAGVINSVTFDNLLSNQTYSIKVYTDYNLDDGEGVVTDHLLLTNDTLTTLEKDAPTASITLGDIHEEAINFSVSFLDPSAVLVEDGLDIYISQDDTIIDTIEGVDLTTLNALLFTSLLNNNTYTITVYATYDLNDDVGIRNDVLLAEREFTTLQRPMPSIQAELISITEDTMQLFVDDTNITTDVDLSDLVLTIYDNETDEILTETDIIDDMVTVEITGLTAHTTVRAVITALFDLGDGQGVREGTVFEALYQTTSNEAPTGTIDAMTLTQTTAEFTMSINDTYNTVVEDTLEAHLYEDNVLIDTIILSNASGSYTFTNQAIYHDRSYRIALTTDYDLRDGNGITENYLLSTFVKTDAQPKAPEGAITSVEETASGLVVHYTLYDYDNTLKTDGLTLHYHGESLTLDPSLTSVTIEDYHKGVAYDFALMAAYTTTQDYDTTLASTIFTTTANSVPQVDIDLTTTDESMSGDILITDPDTTLDTYTVSIYQGTSLIHTQTTADISVFDLLSDTEYRIEVTYTYDLNDTEGIQTTTKTTTVTTTAKTVPTVIFNDASLMIDETSISGSIEITDSDDTLESYVIRLFKDGTEVDTLSNQPTFNFTNLESDATYTLRIFKDYDLNKDGLKTNIQSDTVTLTTDQYEVTTVDTITEDTIILSVDADYLSSDFDLSTLKAYAYDASETLIAETAFLNNTFTFKIDGLYADQSITMHLEAEDLTGTLQTIQIETYQTLANAAPSASITTVSHTQTTIDFTAQFTDPDNTITTNLEAHLYENGVLLDTIALSKTQSTYQFTSIAVYADNTYEIIITTDVDLRDEAGLKTDQFLTSYVTENTRNKAPEITIDTVTHDGSGIHITYTLYDYDTTLVTDGLTLTYNTTTITLDESGSVTIPSYLNDTNYDISITAESELRGDTVYSTDETTHQTTALIAPSVTIDATSTQTTIDGSIDWLDPDNTRNASYAIVLYHDGTEVARVTDQTTFNFTGLTSDRAYTITVEYTYNLNDGLGVVSGTTSTTMTTKAYIAPSLSFDESTLTITERVIQGNINIVDTDARLLDYRIELTTNGTLVETFNNTSAFTFDYLFSDTAYTLTIIYTYNLNDGLGVIEHTQTIERTTDAYDVITINELTEDAVIIEIDSTYLELNFDLSTLKAYVYDDQDTLVASAIFTNDAFNLDVSNVYADQELTIVLEAEDMQGNVFVIQTLTDTTESNDKPTATIDDMIQHQTTIDYTVTFTDANETLVSTPIAYLYENGVLIDTMTLDINVNDYTFTNLEVVYNNTYEIRIKADINLRNQTGVITGHNLGSYSQTHIHKKAPTISLDTVTFDPITGITIDYTLYDFDDAITLNGVELIYNGTTITLDETLNHPQTMVISDYYNEDSTLYITVTYQDRYGDLITIQTQTESLSISTLTEPTYTLTETISHDTISGTINWTDPDNTLVTYTIALYHGETLIDTITDTTTYSFTGLYSNEAYRIEVTYTYDMNISAGVTEAIDDYARQTNALTAPTISLINETTTTNTISGDISITDIDNTLLTYDIILLLDGVEVDRVSNQSTFSFTGLYSDQTYSIEVIYQYDLNEITGIATSGISETYQTTALALPTLTVDALTHTLNTITLDISVSDLDATLSSPISVMLYDGTTLIETQTITTTDTVIFANVTKETTYTILIQADIDQNLQSGIYTYTFTEFDETTPNYHPELTYTEVVTEQERIEFYLNINDMYGILTNNLVRIELLDESNIQVGSSDYIESNMKVKLMNLYSDHTYTVNVYVQVDYQDGAGIQEILLDSETFTTEAKTPPTVSVAETIDTTSIQGTLTWTDPDAIKSSHTIKLFLDGVLLETLTDVDNFNFTALYSNETYTVDITTTYNLNDGQGVLTDTVTYTYTTDAYTEPTVTPDNVVITDDAISGDLVVSDPDNRISTYTATLYRGATEVASVTNVATFNFTGLLSDETYTLRISVTYDLNEITDPTTKTTDYTYITDALTVPTLAATNETVTSNAISGDVSITDPDNTLITYTVSLYLDGILVDSVTDIPTFNFTTLYTDTTYELIITYSYDLGDANGVTNDSVSTLYTTNALTVPTGEIETLTVTGTTIETDISTIDDPDNVLLTADVVLFANNVEVERIATTGNETITFATLYDSNTQYVVKLVITYDLNNQEGVQTLTLDQVAYIEATKN